MLGLDQLIIFIKESWNELFQKITWPTSKELETKFETFVFFLVFGSLFVSFSDFCMRKWIVWLYYIFSV